MFAIEVNGNRLHDEGEHDGTPTKGVTRQGGGPLEFETFAEADAHADALFARVQVQPALRPGKRTAARDRYRYVIIDLCPPEAPPPAEQPQAAAQAIEGEPRAPAPAEPETRSGVKTRKRGGG